MAEEAPARPLSKRGHEAWIRVGSSELEIWCRIGAMTLEFAFGHAGRRRERYGMGQQPRGEQPAGTPLQLSVVTTFRRQVTSFCDDGDGRLERRMGAIAARLIVAGETAFRDYLVEQREWGEQRARRAEQRRIAGSRDLREPARGSGAGWVQLEARGAPALILARTVADNELWVIAG